jgi:hypothetical protein
MDVAAIEKVAAFLEAPPLHAAADLEKFLIAARSPEEAKFRLFVRNIAQTVTGQKPLVILHEWHSFNLPGGSYTPDWCILLESGQWLYIENKGNIHQSNYRDARAKLRAAASLNPWALFYETRRAEKSDWGKSYVLEGWAVEHVPPDPGFLVNVLQYFGEKVNGTQFITEKEKA